MMLGDSRPISVKDALLNQKRNFLTLFKGGGGEDVQVHNKKY